MKFLLMIALLLASLVTRLVTAESQNSCVKKICLKVVSQRWLTEGDLKGHNPLSLQSIAVRLRLSNESNHEIVYLTGLGSVEPIGYRLYRKLEIKQWDFLPRTIERNETSFLSEKGEGYYYVRLKPNFVLEYEVADWSNPSRGNENEKGGYDEEHAFSVFIKLGGLEG